MRICQIGTIGFSSDDKFREPKTTGGIPGYIFDLVNGLLSKRIRINFVGKIYNFKPLAGLTYDEIQNKVTSTNKFLIALFIRSFTIKIHKDTIIHAHRPDHLAAFAIFKKNPCLVTLHGQQAVTIAKRKKLLIRSIYFFLEKIALTKADFIIATDKITYDYYCNAYPKHAPKIKIIPTGVNINIFKPLNKINCRSKFDLQKEHKIILYLGRVEPPKKVSDIIKAFKEIYQHNANLRLLIIGDGTQLEEMKILANKLGLKDVVLFFGARMREELPELINCADISVLYSGNEGSPLSVKESLACGIPVVANKVGDVDTVIQDGRNGFLVQKESINSLASAMEKCIEKATSMETDCVRSCEEYSVDVINQKVINVYKKLSSKY